MSNIPPTTPRMEKLLQMLQKSPDDLFLLYALGLENKSYGDPKEAIAWFDRVLAKDPAHCYAYYQKGQVQVTLGDLDAARATFEKGIAAARQKPDPRAEGELVAALEML